MTWQIDRRRAVEIPMIEYHVIELVEVRRRQSPRLFRRMTFCGAMMLLAGAIFPRQPAPGGVPLTGPENVLSDICMTMVALGLLGMVFFLLAAVFSGCRRLLK
jgi:hypothetical protein